MDTRVMSLTAVVVVQLALLIGGGAATPPPVPAVPAVLTLERTHKMHQMSVEQLTHWDVARHERRGLLGGVQEVSEVVQFPVQGSVYRYTGSPYLTRVNIGNPPKNFTVLVDTGSSSLWVACTPCSGCPINGFQEPYDPGHSSSSSVLSCSDDWCRASILEGLTSCESSDHHGSCCSYNLAYGSGATTAGYYVSDQIHFDTVGGDSTGFSSSIIFGCNNMQSGDLTEVAFDGIIGIGPDQQSINSQLNSLGQTPLVFSLCMKSSDSGDGILIFGEAMEAGLVYTPLLSSKSYYSLHLESIHVNGQKLPVDPSVFTSRHRTTIMDSGTTLAYLPEEAYDPFINAISAAVDPSVRPVSNGGGDPCFVTSGSLDSLFPSVTLRFAGGAEMALNPQNYLLPQSLLGNPLMFCIGWKRSEGGLKKLTIFGDIILMNKLIVHDLDNMRFGWVDYDYKEVIHRHLGVGGNGVQHCFLHSS